MRTPPLERAVRIAAAIACLGLACADAPAPAPTASAGDARFAAIARTYFYAGFRQAPSTATVAGEHRFDELVDDVSPGAFAAELQRDRTVLAAIESLDADDLSPDTALDRRLLDDSIRDDLLLTGTLAQWKHNPDTCTSIASTLIYALVERAFAPLDARMRSAIARERGIPAMLARGDANITTVDAATRETAAIDADGAVDFFRTSVPQAFASVRDRALQAQLRAANAAVVVAMRRHAAFIHAIVPRGTFAIGASAYAQRLRFEDGITLSLPAYREVGQRAFAQTRAWFVATSKRVDPSRSPAANLARLQAIHPTPARLNAAANADLVRLRAFVIAKNIISLPPDANIRAVDTPPFQRAFLSAEMDAPGPLETVATRAYYYVTPVDPTWSRAEQEGFLAQFNDFERPIISAHEVYPGHFVNFTIDRELHLSLTRLMLQSSEFAEGWAHYDEQMVVDEDWGNGDPRVRMTQLFEALLRNCRYIAGLNLHTAGWSVARTERFFTGECYLTPALASEEALRGTQDPMYGYYTLGKLMILKLRDDYRKKMGAAYTLEGFHDALLAHGDPPVPYLRPILLGADDDGKPL